MSRLDRLPLHDLRRTAPPAAGAAGPRVVNGICVRCGEVMQLPFGMCRRMPITMTPSSGACPRRGERHDDDDVLTDLSCTRAQAVTFLWRAAGRPEPSGNTAFADVPADSYYAAAVAWAAENNVTNGTGSGCFSPDAPCTRTDRHVPVACGRGRIFGSTAFADVPAGKLLCRGRCLGGGEQRYERHRQRLLQPG